MSPQTFHLRGIGEEYDNKQMRFWHPIPSLLSQEHAPRIWYPAFLLSLEEKSSEDSSRFSPLATWIWRYGWRLGLRKAPCPWWRSICKEASPTDIRCQTPGIIRWSTASMRKVWFLHHGFAMVSNCQMCKHTRSFKLEDVTEPWYGGTSFSPLGVFVHDRIYNSVADYKSSRVGVGCCMAYVPLFFTMG